MNKVVKKLFGLILLIISLIACGGSGTTSVEKTSPIKTINGQAIDGYITGATVCLDINANNLCDINEPSSTTQKDGIFSFSTKLTGIYPIIINGGIDTATNKEFIGTLKNIIEINKQDSINNLMITPLTTLSSILYQDNLKVNSNYTFQEAKEEIATNLNLSLSQLESNPMEDKKVFEKVQKVIQTANILSNDINNIINEEKIAFNYIMEQISVSVANDINSKDINVSKIIDKLKNSKYNEKEILISKDIKEPLIKYIDNIKEKTNNIIKNENLDNFQLGLDSFTEEFIADINNKQVDNLLLKVELFTNKNVPLIILENNGSSSFVYSLISDDNLNVNINEDTGKFSFNPNFDFNLKDFNISKEIVININNGISKENIVVSINIDDFYLNNLDKRKLSYSITGEDSANFTIDKKTGIINVLLNPIENYKKNFYFTEVISDGTNQDIKEFSLRFNPSSTRITGKVIDGYIAGANVIYENINTYTDNNGSFSMLIPNLDFGDNNKKIISKGGIDITTNQPYNGKLKAVIPNTNLETSIVITPITTLIAEIITETDSLYEIKQKIASNLDLNIKTIDIDPFLFIDKEESFKAIKVILIIQKNIDMICSLDINDTTIETKIYKAIANNLIEGNNLESSIIEMINNLPNIIDIDIKEFDKIKEALLVVNRSLNNFTSIESLSKNISSVSLVEEVMIESNNSNSAADIATLLTTYNDFNSTSIDIDELVE